MSLRTNVIKFFTAKLTKKLTFIVYNVNQYGLYKFTLQLQVRPGGTP